MKGKLAILTTLLLFPMVSLAAKVEYEHPAVTIVAVDESLDSVLRALSTEMKIEVSAPDGINPVINCDIQNQPIKRAFKNLLGELSYSLTWADDGERLTGVTILPGDGVSGVAVATKQYSTDRGNTASNGSDGGMRDASPSGPASASNQAYDDPQAAEHVLRVDEEREAHEAQRALRRAEEETAHRARVEEERARRKEVTRKQIEDLGLPFPLPE